ncbi:MAG TPA: hypothetical protein DCY13_13780 [Verrucomicrobiales bacterium]|nr:hypothetical protein [Verrucomicrobiales bacterium]
MSADRSKRKRVLFVDDEPAFLETIATVIEQTQRDLWEPCFAESAGKALSILQDQPVNLVVIDIEMPVIDGLQFLSLVHRKHPNVSKVVLTGYASEDRRAACLGGGAELFLEKPRTPQDLQSILATLHELARLQPEEGFRGVLRRVGLPDIVQMECLSRHSVILFVSTEALQGEIFIKDGDIIHARAGDLTGEAAFNRVLGLKGGEFDLRPFREPPEHSIEGQWEFLLMEAARQVDEESQSARTGAPPSTPAAASAVSLDSMPDLFKAVAPGAKPAAVPDKETAVPRPRAASPAAVVSDAAPAVEQSNQVDEILVCSPQGEVIYEWQCREADRRIDLLEFLSQKSRQFPASLKMGRLDRLEILTAQAKVVAQLQPDCGVFIRTSKGVPAEEAPIQLRMSKA